MTWSDHVRQRWTAAQIMKANASKASSFPRRMARALPLPESMRRRLRGLLRPEPARDAASKMQWMPATWYAPFWPRMPAFALPAFYDGQIRMNVSGRERSGMLDPENYERACQELAAELYQCRDPATGRSVVKDIVFTHPGDPMAVSATEADIIVVWQTAFMSLTCGDAGTIGPIAPRRSGGHTGGHGISIWHGTDFVHGDHGVRSSFDVVPTLIECLDGSIISSVDGQSFSGLIRTLSIPD